MASFVVGDDALFFRIEHQGFLLEATNDALDSLLKVFNRNGLGRGTGSWKVLALIQ